MKKLLVFTLIVSLFACTSGALAYVTVEGDRTEHYNYLKTLTNLNSGQQEYVNAYEQQLAQELEVTNPCAGRFSHSD